jgi:hypothetical protein
MNEYTELPGFKSTQGTPNSGSGVQPTGFFRKLWNGVKTIWAGVGTVFTATGTQVDAEGNKVILTNTTTGEVITEKNTGFNFGAAIAAIGAIVGVIRNKPYTDPITGRTYEQNGSFVNQNDYEAKKRAGRAILFILGGLGVLITGIILIRKNRKK